MHPAMHPALHPEGDGSSLEPAPPRPRLALAAIVRNEGPYLLEWIAHHRALGIGRFLIADNDSTDETTAVLAALARAGIVDHLPFPTVPGVAPQLAAYEAILRRHGGEADWIAFLDADEFLVPAPPHRSLAAVIAALDPGPDVGSIAVNWALYGSSGQRAAGGAPVAERFVRRARRTCGGNHHYKSIVRADAVRGVANPHFFLLGDGLRRVHADGSELAPLPRHSPGLSARIPWEPLRINHYVVKSWEEFRYRKRARGRAMGGPRRPESFFSSHDRNEVLDPMPSWLVRAAAAEASRIEAAVRARAAEGDASPGAARWPVRLRALFRPGSGPRGGVEAVEVIDDVAQIRGWAIAPGGRPAADFAVTLDGQPAAVAGIVRTWRCDVVARFPEAPVDCGFLIRIAWPPAAPAGPGPRLAVAARYGTAGRWDLSVAEVQWLGVPPEAQAVPAAAGRA
jgi:hypothetical protein